MGSLFRSEEMSLCNLILHKESAFACLAELGEHGLVQFNNLNKHTNVFQLRFVKEVQECGKLLRILRHIRKAVISCGLRIGGSNDSAIPELRAHPNDLQHLAGTLKSIDEELHDITRTYEVLWRKKIEFHERWHVLTCTEQFFFSDRDQTADITWSDSFIKTLIRDDFHYKGSANKRRDQDYDKLRYVAGAIVAHRFFTFERVLWRISHSNFYMRHAEIPEDLETLNGSDEWSLERKYAFIIMFTGDLIRDKVLKVCRGFGANLYECPESPTDQAHIRAMIGTELEDLKLVLEQTDDHRRRVLSAAATDLSMWTAEANRLFNVYYMMNFLHKKKKYFQAECWMPTADIPYVREILLRGAQRVDPDGLVSFSPILTVIPTDTMTPSQRRQLPPTFYRTNHVTKSFQLLIDAYGVASYRELNPAPYLIVTFPFLFAVMFGDIGHGALLLIFAYWMVAKEKKLIKQAQQSESQNEIWNILFGGRYVLLLMGSFTIYTGLIYNDVFSKSVNIFGSHWSVHYNESTVMSNDVLQLDPKDEKLYRRDPYIFGLDPIWNASGESAIVTTNSIKMKLAIILGVSQMIFGLVLSAFNYIHFREYVEFFLVFLPQITFLIALFGYLALLIVIKWWIFAAHKSTPNNTTCAPSVLVIFIDMILQKNTKVNEGCDKNMFSGQGYIQLVLISLAFLCVPIMLLGKPLYVYWQRKKNASQFPTDSMKKPTANGYIEKTLSPTNVFQVDDSDINDDEWWNEEEEEPEESDDDDGLEQEHEEQSISSTEANLTEIFINQCIQTIESVLGSVSHTASYLRLWALSLAHNQLSEVLWHMVLSSGLKRPSDWLSSLFICVYFSIWAILTVSILVVMEGLSAFLHTLRLHWVEFQSKFYKGAGEAFRPFHFEDMVPKIDDEEH